MLASLVRGLAVVQRGRTAAADNIRQIVPGIRDGFAAYCGLLVLLGMITAGFVLLPLGLLLLILGLLHDSADRNLVGGVALSLVALFYLVGPVLLIQVASRLAFGRLQRRANQLADRVEGKR
jgi:hypothetical protein